MGRRSGVCVPIPFPGRQVGVGSRQRLEEGEGRPGLGLGTPELRCASFSAREEDPALQEAPRLPGSHRHPPRRLGSGSCSLHEPRGAGS